VLSSQWLIYCGSWTCLYFRTCALQLRHSNLVMLVGTMWGSLGHNLVLIIKLHTTHYLRDICAVPRNSTCHATVMYHSRCCCCYVCSAHLMPCIRLVLKAEFTLQFKLFLSYKPSDITKQ
jgi:hypothetical protein